MLERFTSALDCVDIGFIPDGLLDRLPQPSQIGPRRTPAGVDLNRPRIRTALSAVLAVGTGTGGFTVADLTGMVNALQDDVSYTPGRPHTPPALKPGERSRPLLTLREHVIAPGFPQADSHMAAGTTVRSRRFGLSGPSTCELQEPGAGKNGSYRKTDHWFNRRAQTGRGEWRLRSRGLRLRSRGWRRRCRGWRRRSRAAEAVSHVNGRNTCRGGRYLLVCAGRLDRQRCRCVRR